MTTDAPDDPGLRLAALELLLCALNPAAPANAFTDVVSQMLEPVVTDDGRTFVDADRLREILQASVAEARALMPEQDAETERALDEGFEEIGRQVDELTRPKAQH